MHPDDLRQPPPSDYVQKKLQQRREVKAEQEKRGFEPTMNKKVHVDDAPEQIYNSDQESEKEQPNPNKRPAPVGRRHFYEREKERTERVYEHSENTNNQGLKKNIQRSPMVRTIVRTKESDKNRSIDKPKTPEKIRTIVQVGTKFGKSAGQRVERLMNKKMEEKKNKNEQLQTEPVRKELPPIPQFKERNASPLKPIIPKPIFNPHQSQNIPSESTKAPIIAGNIAKDQDFIELETLEPQTATFGTLPTNQVPPSVTPTPSTNIDGSPHPPDIFFSGSPQDVPSQPPPLPQFSQPTPTTSQPFFAFNNPQPQINNKQLSLISFIRLKEQFDALPDIYASPASFSTKINNLKNYRQFFTSLLSKMNTLSQSVKQIKEKQAQIDQLRVKSKPSGLQKLQLLKKHHQNQTRCKTSLFESRKVLSVIGSQTDLFKDIFNYHIDKVSYKYVDPDQGVVLMTKYLTQMFIQAECAIQQTLITKEIQNLQEKESPIEVLERQLQQICLKSAELSELQQKITRLKRRLTSEQQHQNFSNLLSQKVDKQVNERWGVYDLLKQTERLLELMSCEE